MQGIAATRLRKEIADLERDPPPGIVCYPIDDSNIAQLEAYIKGPPDTPYESGTFRLAINVPDRYPFDPPQMRFKTRIYHPNIDESGRICADILKHGENGGWKPSLNLSTTLISLRALLSSPNPDDPLDADIAREYKLDYPRFLIRAKEYTTRCATGEQTTSEGSETYGACETTKEEDEHVMSPGHELPDVMSQSASQGRKSRLSLSSKKRIRVQTLSEPKEPASELNEHQQPAPSYESPIISGNAANNDTSSSSSSSSSSPLPPLVSDFNMTAPIPQRVASPTPTTVSDSTAVNELVLSDDNRTPTSPTFSARTALRDSVFMSPIKTATDDHQNADSSTSAVSQDIATSDAVPDQGLVPTETPATQPALQVRKADDENGAQRYVDGDRTPPDTKTISSQQSSPKRSSPYVDNDTHCCATQSVEDNGSNRRLSRKSVTVNQSALREMSLNTADDVELIRKPAATSNKRNKLSLGKTKRRRTIASGASIDK